MASFHNPYSFVPRLPRDEVLRDKDLGDAAPPVAPPRWHHKLFDEQWTGTLRLSLRTVTPLLLCDAQEAQALDDSRLDNRQTHLVYPARVDSRGMPYIPPTSLKGALSTAYEIVTNSRYRVLDDWSAPLGYRPVASSALQLKPVRIIGDSPMKAQLLESARLEIYGSGSANQSLKHGDMLRAYVSQGKAIPLKDGARPTDGSRAYDGWAWISGKNATGKKSERFFYSEVEPPPEVEIDDEVIRAYENLVRNYQQVHEMDFALGRTGPTTGKDLVWSRHIKEKDAAQLKPGDLCWAKLDRDKLRIVALYPVTISRRLYERSPLGLVDSSLRPPENMRELSPAERLFGWTAPKGPGAFRGKVRIGREQCLAQQPEDAIETFPNPGVPLAILGQPKPQQERFYVARNKFGEPLGKDAQRGEGYGSDESGLRGYKVYPHQRVPDGYWDDPMTDRTAIVKDGWAQEYRRPGPRSSSDVATERDNQNRSVTSWVKPGTEFEVDVYVTNITDFELGALLWLFSMEEGAYFRLGGAKPLGLGSVRIDWLPESTTLMRGSEWRKYWRSLGEEPAATLDRDSAQQLISDFENHVRGAFKLDDGAHPKSDFLKAFLRACKGHADGLPVHYPRAAEEDQDPTEPIPQNPCGENFKWFVANEREHNRYSLPNILEDRGLPVLPANPQRKRSKDPQNDRGGRR